MFRCNNNYNLRGGSSNAEKEAAKEIAEAKQKSAQLEAAAKARADEAAAEAKAREDLTKTVEINFETEGEGDDQKHKYTMGAAPKGASQGLENWITLMTSRIANDEFIKVKPDNLIETCSTSLKNQWEAGHIQADKMTSAKVNNKISITLQCTGSECMQGGRRRRRRSKRSSSKRRRRRSSKKRKGSCANKRRSRSCRRSKRCSWTKRSKRSKGHCRRSKNRK